MAGGEALQTTEFSTVSSAPPETKPELTVVNGLTLDRTRDALLTEFGKKTLEDRYLLAGESYQDMFARVATAYADDADHAQRVYDYMSKLWFMPATPVLSNGGADRGLPISCFLNSVNDSLDGIQNVWNENVSLASNGGGIGTYWGGVRSIGEKVKGVDAYHMLLFQNNTNMPYEVAATAWTQLLGCKTVNANTWDAIRAFRDRFVDKGPEIIP